MRVLFFLFVLLSYNSFSQSFSQRNYSITKTQIAPKIDGLNDDNAWENSSFSSNFISEKPINGEAERIGFETFWKAVYDNQAIYFLVLMKDPNPDSILSQLSQRDKLNSANTDKIEIRINPFNDGQLDYSFSVSASGVQQDIKFSSNGNEEINWNMVWNSATKINDDGWIAEFEIPYSALRFPQKENQNWNFNIRRTIRRFRQSYTWNYVDNSMENTIDQTGIISGLSNIEPPTRLTLFPYISSVGINNGDTILKKINGGLDIKYGINQSFTLDMTLIPDFGQVGFDNQVLNLSPFEIQYDEKRSFFNEGTELFNKSGLFYSRRINDNLLNASKITGKTNNNLGIGFLNAITKNTDDENDLPQSNYNVLVLDKTLKNSSSITFTNTNVQRKNNSGSEANVSGLNLNLKNKKRSIQLKTNYKYSLVRENENLTTGFSSLINLEKISGKFQYGIYNLIESDTYDPNDLGLLFNNNEISYSAYINYRTLRPNNIFINFYNSFETNYNELYNPKKFVDFSMSYRQRVTFRNYLTWGFRTSIKPVNQNDYFEARASLDDVFIRSKSFEGRTFLSSDYRKKIALDFSLNGGIYNIYEAKKIGYRISPRLRINNHFFVSYVFSTESTKNDFGYHQLLKHQTNSENDIIVFSNRDLNFFTNVLKGQYVVNNKISFDIKFRHHWQTVKNNSFHQIDDSGFKLNDKLEYNLNDFQNNNDYNNDIYYDTNFNAWNIDLNFNYWFAPGSELSIVWKNSILTNGDKLQNYYVENLIDLINNQQENSISLKVRYYLDYQRLKN